MRSSAPPAANGAIKRTGFDGKACADATAGEVCADAAAQASRSAAAIDLKPVRSKLFPAIVSERFSVYPAGENRSFSGRAKRRAAEPP
jgi:hypothetical protein